MIRVLRDVFAASLRCQPEEFEPKLNLALIGNVEARNLELADFQPAFHATVAMSCLNVRRFKVFAGFGVVDDE